MSTAYASSCLPTHNPLERRLDDLLSAQHDPDYKASTFEFTSNDGLPKKIIAQIDFGKVESHSMHILHHSVAADARNVWNCRECSRRAERLCGLFGPEGSLLFPDHGPQCNVYGEHETTISKKIARLLSTVKINHIRFLPANDANLGHDGKLKGINKATGELWRHYACGNIDEQYAMDTELRFLMKGGGDQIISLLRAYIGDGSNLALVKAKIKEILKFSTPGSPDAVQYAHPLYPGAKWIDELLSTVNCGVDEMNIIEKCQLVLAATYSGSVCANRDNVFGIGSEWQHTQCLQANGIIANLVSNCPTPKEMKGMIEKQFRPEGIYKRKTEPPKANKNTEMMVDKLEKDMAEAHLRIMTVADAVRIAQSGTFEETGIEVWVNNTLPSAINSDRSITSAFDKVRSSMQNKKNEPSGMKVRGSVGDWGTGYKLPLTLRDLADCISNGETIYANFCRERVTHINAENVPYTCVKDTFWCFHGARTTVMHYDEPEWQKIIAVLHMRKERWDHWMIVGDRSDDWLIANARNKNQSLAPWTKEGGLPRQSIRSDELGQRTPSSASSILEQIGRNIDTYIPTSTYLTERGLPNCGVQSKMMTGIGCSPQIYNMNMISNGGIEISTENESERSDYTGSVKKTTINRIAF